MSVMGLDVGTSGVKAVIYSAEGRLLGAGFREYPLHHPRPEWSELDAEEVWLATKDAIRQATAAAGSNDPVRALAAASQGEACVPVDARGRPLARAIVSFDPRTQPQIEAICRVIPPLELFRLSGMSPHAMFTVCKIAWYQEHCPDVNARVTAFLCFGEYVLRRLGIERPEIDLSQAARTMALDRRTFDWSDRILNAARIDRRLLPPISRSGQAIGVIPPRIARDVGLPAGVIAATGGHDQPCGALGSGVSEPGIALDSTGTVECVTAVFERAPIARKMLSGSYPIAPHVTPGVKTTIAFNFTGGVLLRWFRDQFGQPEVAAAACGGTNPYDRLIAAAAEDAGSIIALPHFTTTGNPWLDSRSAGAIVGLHLSSTRGQLIRALLDGVTYEIRLNLERLESAGIPIRRLRAVGGGARSARWTQWKADIFGRPVATINVDECAAFGASLLAGTACGIFRSAQDAAKQLVIERVVYEPRAPAASTHDERFARYRELYPTLRPWFHGAGVAARKVDGARSDRGLRSGLGE